MFNIDSLATILIVIACATAISTILDSFNLSAKLKRKKYLLKLFLSLIILIFTILGICYNNIANNEKDSITRTKAKLSELKEIRGQKKLDKLFNKKSIKPNLYLEVNKAEIDSTGRLSLTFYLFNKSNIQAEKVIIIFGIRKELSPHGKPDDMVTEFENDKEFTGIRYSGLEDQFVYPMQEHLKLSFILSYYIGDRYVQLTNQEWLELPYTIKDSKGICYKTLRFKSPLFSD